jgi:large subunit ribosomal protein L15
MRVDQLAPSKGSTKKPKRVGRGIGGKGGKTAGRGTKGQYARNTVARGFEGGQMPLIRRIPKRGFNNKRFKIVVVPVNLSDLNLFEEGSVVDLVALQQAGLTNGTFDSVKILGRGELTHKLTVRANAFSEAARAAIEKLGGTAEVVS